VAEAARDSHRELPVDPDTPDVPPQPSRLAALGLVLAGGIAGTAARSGVATLVPVQSGRWPVATLLVNLTGAVLLGVLLEALAGRPAPRLLTCTGFCGAYTTYSTLAVETDLLVRDHAPGLAASYLLVSVLAGVAAAALGIGISARVLGSSV
jgi:fluoride exporter